MKFLQQQNTITVSFKIDGEILLNVVFTLNFE